MKLRNLVTFARERSPYYRDLYRNLPANLPNGPELISMLPVVDSVKFWEANTLTENRLLTGKMENGIVFKSGGTTGAPKFSVFTREEWKHFCRTFGRGLTAGGLQDGERVANLFYAGELYASFLFILKSFEEASKASLHFPLGGATTSDVVLKTIQDFSVTTVVGTPTMLVQLAETAAKSNQRAPSIARILFGGESLYGDQRERLLEIFPNVMIQSIGYASVDAGLLGYADPSCGPEEHRAFGAETIYEIVDEASGEAIQEVGVEGKAVVTYLDRYLMPIIRYPVGDRAMWVEEEGVHLDRRFRLLGRSEEAARIGVVSLFYDDLRDIYLSASKTDPRFSLAGFQMIVRHHGMKDQLILRVAPTHAGASAQEWLNVLNHSRPMLAEEVSRGNIHETVVEIVAHDGLEKNGRTGKLKRVLDQRQK